MKNRVDSITQAVTYPLPFLHNNSSILWKPIKSAQSNQIYENCGEKATFSFFLKKEEKNPGGKAWIGENRKADARSGKRKRRKDAKCGNPGNEKRGLEPRGKAGYRDGTPGTERRKRYRMKPPGKRPHRLRRQRSGRTPKIPPPTRAG